jgi:hypothetical protein
MDQTNFVVLGLPRSGTKFFCKTLSEQSNIWIPSWNNTYEPFNLKKISTSSEIFDSHLYDHDLIVKKLINAKKEKQKEFMGFKTFLVWHRDFKEIVDKNNLQIIILIRKNFWKVFGSFLLAIDNSDYTGSSTKFSPFLFIPSNRENRRIIDIFNNFCFQYWQLENVYSFHKNFIDKIYFEDLLKSKKFDKIDTYFKNKITFQTEYRDEFDLQKYFANFDEIKKFIVDHCKTAPKHYNKLPSYFLENIGI